MDCTCTTTLLYKALFQCLSSVVGTHPLLLKKKGKLDKMFSINFLITSAKRSINSAHAFSRDLHSRNFNPLTLYNQESWTKVFHLGQCEIL